MLFSTNRRSVLQQVGAFAAVAAAASGPRFARAAESRGEDYWELVRGHFIFPRPLFR